MEQNPYIGCISVTAAVVDTSGRAPVLNISETALAFNEDDAVSTACYTVFDDILGRRAVRQYLEEASKTSSQQHQVCYFSSGFTWRSKRGVVYSLALTLSLGRFFLCSAEDLQGSFH